MTERKSNGKELELLKAMVAIPSVNPFHYYKRPSGTGYVGLGTEETMNLFVEASLRDAGFEVSRQDLHPKEQLAIDGKVIDIPARWNVLGVSYPKGRWNGKSILFFGHTDTVDVKQGWESDPFSIDSRLVDGRQRWYGLGANDMKGGLAAILAAISDAHSQEYAVKVAFVVDEEYYSFGAEVLCDSDFMSDVVVAIAPEIGDPSMGENWAPKDEQRIGIGRTGRVEYDVKVLGAACHGADAFVSTSAVNAVHESAKLQVEFVKYCASVKRIFSAHGAESLNSAYLSYHSGGVPMLSVPYESSFVIDRIFLPDESPEVELERLKQFARETQNAGMVDARARIEISPRPRPTSPCQPYVCSLEVPEVKRVMANISKIVSHVSFFIGRSVADENRVAARRIPTLTIGPVGAGSHTNKEWVDPASISRLTEIFRATISSF